jgi:(R)-2-hydroxyacyl-CoA dehydratese activating ATPase
MNVRENGQAPVGPYARGVDLGSTTAKTVILDSLGTMVGSSIIQMGAVSRAAVDASIEQAMKDAGIQEQDVSRTVSTGYGRRLITQADKSFTEITCHARGAATLWPGVRLVIDIGGQDSKVIAVDENGFVDNFAMNDRCASGTGRFFDVLSRALEVEIGDIGDLALQGSSDLEVSSMCATFAETEVISLLAGGAEKADIAASVHRAVAARTLGLVAQVGRRTPVVMTGGVAKNKAAVQALSRALRLPVEIPSDPQISGAYGAALLALDDITAGEIAINPASEATALAGVTTGPAPSCNTCGAGGGNAGSDLLQLTVLERV